MKTGLFEKFQACHAHYSSCYAADFHNYHCCEFVNIQGYHGTRGEVGIRKAKMSQSSLFLWYPAFSWINASRLFLSFSLISKVLRKFIDNFCQCSHYFHVRAVFGSPYGSTSFFQIFKINYGKTYFSTKWTKCGTWFIHLESLVVYTEL